MVWRGGGAGGAEERAMTEVHNGARGLPATIPTANGGGSQSMLDRLTQLGVGDLELKPGDHTCAFYRGAAGREAILRPYIEKGLNDGDKCICILDVEDMAERRRVAERLQANVPRNEHAPADQFEVLDFTETYIRNGRFLQDEWFELLERSVSSVFTEQGYKVARVVGDAAWALIKTCPGVDELCTYEARVNWFAPRYPQILLCLSDLERFSGELVVQVLMTHPKVLINNMVVENPFYIEPEEFLARSR